MTHSMEHSSNVRFSGWKRFFLPEITRLDDVAVKLQCNHSHIHPIDAVCLKSFTKEKSVCLSLVVCLTSVTSRRFSPQKESQEFLNAADCEKGDILVSCF